MKYECWGHISKYDDGRWTVTKIGGNKPEPIDPCQLPDWIKIKIAMMDFIKEYEELPCGSHKACYNRLELLIYFLFTEVSCVRHMNGENGGRNEVKPRFSETKLCFK